MRAGIGKGLGLAAGLWMLGALASDGGKIAWSTDYAKGIEQAKKEGKKVFLFFTADG